MSEEGINFFFNFLLFVHEQVFLLSVLHLQLQILLHYIGQGGHSPVVALEPEHLLKPRVLIEEHFIHDSLAGIPDSPLVLLDVLGVSLDVLVFPVNVVLGVGVVLVAGEGESMDCF